MTTESFQTPWQTLGTVPVTDLFEAKVQLHWAVQIVAAFGNTLLQPRPDDSQSNLGWIDSCGALCSHPTSDGWSVGLRLADRTLIFLTPNNTIQEEFGLSGQTLPQGVEWLTSTHSKASGSPLPKPLALREYDMPSHPVEKNSVFQLNHGAPTLVPVLMGYFIRGSIMPEQKNPLNRYLITTYRPILQWVLRRPKIIILSATLIVVSGLWPWTQLGREFMPELDEGDLMYMPITYASISIGKARQILQQTDKLIRTVPEVKTVFGKIGRAETATDTAPLTMIETVIQFKPQDQWRVGMSTKKLHDELKKIVKLPGLTNSWVWPIKTRIDMLATGIKTPVGIKVAGPDLKEIEKIGKRLEEVLPNVQGTISVYSERVTGGRYVKVDIDRDKAARFGLNIADIQAVVRTAIGGMNVTETVEGLERYPVNLRYPQSYRNSFEQLKVLPVITPQNERIALGDVADIYIDDGPPTIKSENARLNGWTFVDIENRDLGSYVTAAQQAVAEHIKLPPGYSINWSGQYEYMQRAKEKLKTVVPFTLLIIIILLYINFRNFTEVAVIMGTLPFALIGGLWLMYWLGYDMSVAVGVGFIALAGVAVELGVLMLVYLNQARQRIITQVKSEQRLLTRVDITQAVIEGAALRVRPIMMTAAAITVGLVPIMFGGGTGSEVMQRIAAPMIGGMLSALLLTLLVIPAIYHLWQTGKLTD